MSRIGILLPAVLTVVGVNSCGISGSAGNAEVAGVDSVALAEYAGRFEDIFNHGYDSDPEGLKALEDAYHRYALLGKCAELSYGTSVETERSDDIRRDSTLAVWLAERGVTRIAATDPDAVRRSMVRSIDSLCSATPGLKACVFFDSLRGKYIVGFAGTEPQSADIITDIDGAFSISEPQNAAAISVVESVAAMISRREGVTSGVAKSMMELTGHSLGGRLASVGAILHGVDAVVYNPANIPIDLQKRIADDSSLQANADRHLLRIHSLNDELTGGMNLGQSLTPFVPVVAKVLESGAAWLDDDTSLGTLKSIVSAAPEIAGVADALFDMFSDTKATTHECDTKIVLALVKNMRRYNINADDLQNPLFYRYCGREVTPTPGRGGHSIAGLNNDIDSVSEAIDYLRNSLH